MRTETDVLIGALRILAEEIESEDGVANACIAEAADRLEECESILKVFEKLLRAKTLDELVELSQKLNMGY